MELHEWLFKTVPRVGSGKLPTSVNSEINDFFVYYWANHRFRRIEEGEEFYARLPKKIQQGLINNYLYEDVFYEFRNFFVPSEDNCDFLFVIAHGL
jgi:hypothetical protein